MQGNTRLGGCCCCCCLILASWPQSQLLHVHHMQLLWGAARLCRASIAWQLPMHASAVNALDLTR
jgi:hypothetical protein